jgi:hypothetical protein
LRQPANFKIGAGAHDEIGATHLGNQARLGFDDVHVLQRRGCNIDGDFVGRQLMDERAPLRFACEDIECLRGGAEACQGHQLDREFCPLSFHHNVLVKPVDG